MFSFPHQTWRCSLSPQLALQPVQLTPKEVTSLLRLTEARRTPQAVAKRVQIVVSAHAHPDWSSKRLAQSLGLKARLIRKWRRRWSQTHSLQNAPRSGATRRFSRRGVQSVAFVLDNGPTHAPKQLPSFVQELATRSDGKLTMPLYWLPVNARLSRSTGDLVQFAAAQALPAQPFLQT